jgi:hypothetical protein
MVSRKFAGNLVKNENKIRNKYNQVDRPLQTLVRSVTKLTVHASSGIGKMWKCCSL